MSSSVVIHFRADRGLVGNSLDHDRMFKVKILMLGPCKSGKTVLANFLADATETSGGEYHPTKGVRILEFECTNLMLNSRNTIAEVELWDCSGHNKFEACWPAMMRDTHGVMFVFNPDIPHQDRELDNFYAHFVHTQGIKDSQCVVVAFNNSKSYRSETSHLSHFFNKIPKIEANLDEDSEAVRNDFTRFLQRVIVTLHEKRDQEELNIMNS